MIFPRWRSTSAVLLVLLTVLIGRLAGASFERERLHHSARQHYGTAGTEAVRDWTRLLDLARGEPVETQLERVNEFFNSRTIFENDIEVWRQNDYWATPLETLVRGRGDCEDFAIAKYVSLLALGVPSSRLRLIYVRAQIGAQLQAHMVLGYYPDPQGEPRILDNLAGNIEWASQRSDLAPVFSFNSEGLWAGGIKASSDPTQRLSRWRELLARLRLEGSL